VMRWNTCWSADPDKTPLPPPSPPPPPDSFTEFLLRNLPPETPKGEAGRELSRGLSLYGGPSIWRNRGNLDMESKTVGGEYFTSS